MSLDSSQQSLYIDTLNPLQRQLLTELGIDFLWGKSVAPNLQKGHSQSAIKMGEEASSDAVAKSRQEVVVNQLEPSTPASQDTVQAHAEEVLKLLKKGRAATTDRQEVVASAPVLSTQSMMFGNATVTATPIQSVSSQSPRGGLSEMSWQALRSYAEVCQRCELSQQRQHFVFANLSEEKQCDWLFIEQVPSEADDGQGQLMSTEAGALFEQMLLALGLSFSEVAVLPLLKCRPAFADHFKQEWLSACAPILLEQIKRIRPKCIVAFGDAAATLLQEDKGLLALRRQDLFFEHPTLGNIPLIATFSPQYLLVNCSEKAQTWQDLKRARQVIRRHAD